MHLRKLSVKRLIIYWFECKFNEKEKIIYYSPYFPWAMINKDKMISLRILTSTLNFPFSEIVIWYRCLLDEIYLIVLIKIKEKIQ